MMLSYVYFVQAGTDGPIKIGITKHDPRKRLVKIQSDCPYPIRLIGAISGGLACEQAFHRRLASHKTQGEWFNPHPEVMSAVGDALSGGSVWEIPTNASRRFKHDHPIARYRKENNITLAQLASLVGISHASISRFESGHRKPDLKSIVDIYNATGIPPRELRPDIAALFEVAQ